MITNAMQKKAFGSIAAALPFGIDPAKVAVEQGLSYTVSPVKAHDYAAGVMGAFGSVVEHIGVLRGLPAQTMKLNRRRCGLLLNSAQLQFLNGYGCLMDTLPIGPDNGTYRANDGRYVTLIGLPRGDRAQPRRMAGASARGCDGQPSANRYRATWQ